MPAGGVRPLPRSTPGMGSTPRKTRGKSHSIFSARGLTIDQVARERGLTPSTIEGHLACFVQTGRIAIGRLLPEEKFKTIDRQLTVMEDKPLGEIKRALGEDCSYGEIRLVQAHRNTLQPGTRQKSLMLDPGNGVAEYLYFFRHWSGACSGKDALCVVKTCKALESHSDL